MTADTASRTPTTTHQGTTRDTAFLAFVLLRSLFGLAPILFGIDKFFNWMVDWDIYLWSGISEFFPGSPDQIMYGVGVVEIVAGLVVLAAPRIGGPLVAFWLGAIVVNLVLASTVGDVATGPAARPVYWDIALRDLGLMGGAIALTLLAFRYSER